MERFHWLDPHDADIWTILWAFITWLPEELDEHLKSSEKMSLTDYLAMLAIAQADDNRTTMTKLSKATRMSPSRLSHVMDRLEARGMTERTPNSEDRRSTIACLTPEGEEFMVQATPLMIQRLRETIFEAITEDEADQLTFIMRKILARAQQITD